jgi:hypothetical protein
VQAIVSAPSGFAFGLQTASRVKKQINSKKICIIKAQYRAIRISSFTRRRHLLSFCYQIALRNSPMSCQWRSQFQTIRVDVRVKTRPEMKMTLEDANIIKYFLKGE